MVQTTVDDLPVLTPDASGTLTFTLSDGSPFRRWSASYGPDPGDLEPLDQGGEGADPDAINPASPVHVTTAEIDSPPSGEWVVFVFVGFGDGDLSYWWLASVH